MVKDFLEHLEGLFENLWAQRDPALLDLSPDEVHGWPMEYRLISLAQTADGLYFQCQYVVGIHSGGAGTLNTWILT